MEKNLFSSNLVTQSCKKCANFDMLFLLGMVCCRELFQLATGA